MRTLSVLRKRPGVFFRLAGIRLEDFEALAARTQPLWETQERRRLSRPNRQRAIGAGNDYTLYFSSQLLLCLIYYRTYISHGFLGLLFGVSDSTSIRATHAMTKLLASHFKMPEREVRLSEDEKADLLYLMVDGTERPIQRPRKPSGRRKMYSGKKKRHTHVHQIVTDSNKRIRAVGPAQEGRKHDKRIYDESRLRKPLDMMTLADLGYWGTSCEVPVKKKKGGALSKEDKAYNRWFSALRVGIEHAIARMKKFRIFSDIRRGNRFQDMIAKNIGAIANINLKTTVSTPA